MIACPHESVPSTLSPGAFLTRPVSPNNTQTSPSVTIPTHLPTLPLFTHSFAECTAALPVTTKHDVL